MQGWVNFNLFIIKRQSHLEKGHAVVFDWIKYADKLLDTGLQQGFQLWREQAE